MFVRDLGNNLHDVSDGCPACESKNSFMADIVASNPITFNPDGSYEISHDSEGTITKLFCTECSEHFVVENN